MNKELIDLQDIESVFISHCKTLGCEDAYIKVCKNKFGNIETVLKRFEEINNYNVASGLGKYLDIIKYNLSEDATSDLPEALEKVYAAGLKLATVELKLGKDQLALKKLKALEIIKEKQVDVPMFIYNQKLYEEFFTCDFYNRHKDQWLLELTQEEFDLLKEVFN